MKNTFIIGLAVAMLGLASCKEAPVADFKAPSGTIYATKSVTFTNTTEGSDPDYKWTFENADTPSFTGKDGVATWSTPGNYNVTLNAENSKGVDEVTKSVTVEEYIPSLSFRNNSPGSLLITIGTKGLQGNEDEFYWLFWDEDDTKNSVILKAGESIKLNLWDVEEDEEPVDFTGLTELYYAVYSGNFLHSVDAEGGEQPLVWHDAGLSKAEFDKNIVIDVSSDYFHVTIDNQGFSTLNKVIAFMGETIDKEVVGESDKSIDIDEKMDIGYFDAYQGVKVGSYYANTNYIYWFDFDDQFGENASVTFVNDTYKTSQKKQFSVTNNPSTAEEGDIVLNEPRKGNVEKKMFESMLAK